MDKVIRVIQGANGIDMWQKVLSKLNHLRPIGGMEEEGGEREKGEKA